MEAPSQVDVNIDQLALMAANTGHPNIAALELIIRRGKTHELPHIKNRGDDGLDVAQMVACTQESLKLVPAQLACPRRGVHYD